MNPAIIESTLLFLGPGQYHSCLNRADKNPFSTTKPDNDTVDGDKKSWLEWVNTPCSNLEQQIRCLGLRADVCISKRFGKLHNSLSCLPPESNKKRVEN